MLSVTKVSRLSLGVAALGLALAAPVAAETVTVTDIVRGTSDGSITVPTVELTDASIGEDEVRALFATEDPKAIGAALSTLVARSVSLPEVRIEGGALKPDGTDTRGSVIFSGLEMTDVAHGIAGGVAIESATFEGMSGSSFSLGPLVLTDLNMGFLFALGGLAEGEGLDTSTLDSVWTSVSLGASTVTADTGTCSFGGFDAGSLSVRMPERTSLPALFEFMDKAKANQAAAGEATEADDRKAKSEASLDDAARLKSYYFDILSSYAAGPLAIGEIDCAVTNDDEDPIAFSIGEVTVGETLPGTLPDVIVNGLSVENSGKAAGTLSLGTMHILPTEYGAVAELFAEAGDDVDHEWLQENQRRLIPSFGGFEIGDVTMDLPNTSDAAAEGTRIVGSIGALSALFDDYLNGIPTDVRSSATDMTFELPRDASGQMLAMLGLDPLSITYDLAAHWDRARREIVIDNLLVSAGNGGTIILSGVLGGAVPQLFDPSQRTAMRASEGLTLKALNLYVGDEGLLARLLAMAAEQQKADPDQFRTALATMAQGIILLGLGATPDSIPVAGAISTFLREGGELSLSAVAIDPAGAPIIEMQRRGVDPAQILKQFALTVGEAEAQEAPAAETTPAIPESGTKEKTQ